MFSILLPKQMNFFDLFDKQVECTIDAARCFKEIVSSNTLEGTLLQKMRDIEHEGDHAAHTIIDSLDKTFITPFDREDIHALTKELDDIIDMIHTIVNRLKVYKLNGMDRNLAEFADVIEKSVLEVACAVKGLRHMKNSKIISDACIEVNRLENVGDSMRDKMLTELFENFKNDPMHVIKWKEIYQE